jgi:hypothetical protein
MGNVVGWSYHLLRPRQPPQRQKARVASAYQCWKRCWTEMMRELDGVELASSDDFLRQDEIGALYCGSVCVGLSGYRWIDIGMPAARDDSYFKAWPKAALDAVEQRGRLVCVGSNLVVAPEWRGRVEPMRIPQLLLELAVKRFVDSDADLMVGTMRNDRRMNEIVYHLGATALAQGLTHHNVPVDLVVFERSTLASQDLSWVDYYRHNAVVEGVAA